MKVNQKGFTLLNEQKRVLKRLEAKARQRSRKRSKTAQKPNLDVLEAIPRRAAFALLVAMDLLENEARAQWSRLANLKLRLQRIHGGINTPKNATYVAENVAE
jgi:hypothetical protein